MVGTFEYRLDKEESRRHVLPMQACSKEAVLGRSDELAA
jgi:hypothetical protein